MAAGSIADAEQRHHCLPFSAMRTRRAEAGGGDQVSHFVGNGAFDEIGGMPMRQHEVEAQHGHLARSPDGLTGSLAGKVETQYRFGQGGPVCRAQRRGMEQQFADTPVYPNGQWVPADPVEVGVAASHRAACPGPVVALGGRGQPARQSAISCRYSMRVAWDSRKVPSITDVFIVEFCFSTPRIFMHRCSASIVTATPAG